MNINISDYPLGLLEEFEEVITWMRDKIKSYNDLMIEIENNSSFITVIPVTFDSNFKFSVIDIGLDKGKKCNYCLSIIPKSVHDNAEFVAWYSKDTLMIRFEDWMQRMVRYNNISFKDPIIEQYESEIYEGIKILDNDADIKAFNLEQQLLLTKFLKATKVILENRLELESTDESKDVLKSMLLEIDILKNEVTKLPINSFIKKLSSFLAKGKKYSIELFRDIIKDYAKEFLKNEAANIPKYIETTINFFNDVTKI